MSKRFLIILTILVLLLAVVGGLIFWFKWMAPAPTDPEEAPLGDLSGFPVSDPLTNPEPISTPDPSDPTTSPLPPGEDPTPTNPELLGLLTKLSPTSVAGATLLSGAVIYLEKGTGNLYRTTDGRDNQKLTENTLPEVSKVWWGKSKDKLHLIAQYLNPQKAVTTFRGTYSLKTATTSAPIDLVGGEIPNVSALGVALPPNQDQQISLLETPDGVSGVVTEFATGKVRTLFSSHFKNWSIAWPAPTVITLSPRAAAGSPSPLYFLNPNTSTLTRVLADQLGLTSLVNPTGTKLVYSRGLSDLRLYSVKDSATTLLTIATLPEKCVWASDAVTLYCAVPASPLSSQYPDTWWSGEVSFNDSFWQINTETGDAKIILASQTPALDGINLLLDEARGRLIFTDKLSGQLWALDLQ